MSFEAPLATALTKLLINCIGLDAGLGGIGMPVMFATGDWGDTDSFGGLPLIVLALVLVAVLGIDC